MILYRRINKQKKFLLCSLLIGKNLEVFNSTDPSKIGKKGKILLEKKYYFVILDKNGKKLVLPKKECIFKIDNIIVEGELLINEIWERIKKYW